MIVNNYIYKKEFLKISFYKNYLKKLYVLLILIILPLLISVFINNVIIAYSISLFVLIIYIFKNIIIEKYKARIIKKIDEKYKKYYFENINSIENLINKPIEDIIIKNKKKRLINISQNKIKIKKIENTEFDSLNAIREIDELTNDIKEAYFIIIQNKYDKIERIQYYSFINHSLETMHKITIGIVYKNYNNKTSDLKFIKTKVEELDKLLIEEKYLSEKLDDFGKNSAETK